MHRRVNTLMNKSIGKIAWQGIGAEVGGHDVRRFPHDRIKGGHLHVEYLPDFPQYQAIP